MVSPFSKALEVENVNVLVAVFIVVIYVDDDGAVVPLWYISSIPTTKPVKSFTVTVLPLTASPAGFVTIASVS